MKKKQKRFIMISLVLIAMLVVGFGIVCLNGAFGKWTGNVFSITSFDAEAKAVLVKSLRINSSNEIQFKHASMLGGKDWTLYVCFEVSQAKWESFLKSVSFTTRNGRERDVPFEMSALPWWKIEKEKVDTFLCATEGYTAIIALKDENGVRRVFIYTDGGRWGFPKDVWNLFKNQQ
jgi:hypothetical protein